MNERLTFLRTVLPKVARDITFCVALHLPPLAGERKGTWKEVSRGSMEQVSALLDEHADRAEVYVALAAFELGKGRKKAAVVAKDWVSADIDAKVMPGATFEERHANARTLANAVPVPAVVLDSGGGFHVHIRLPEGDRVQDFESPADGVRHVERLAVALRRYFEEKARELFSVDVKLDHTHGAERVWRIAPAWNMKAADGAKVLTADRSKWRMVRVLGRVEAIADTPAANLEFLAPYVTDESPDSGRGPERENPAFDPAMLPPRLRNRWPLQDGDQSENDFAVAAALAEAGHPSEVAAEAIRLRRAALADPEDRAKGAREDYVRRTVERAYVRTGEDHRASGRTRTSLPEPAGPEAFHGLAGEVVRVIGPQSEADPMALLVQLLAALGNVVGRGAHFRAEADVHYLKLFIVLVGETSKGRKGTSWGHVKRLLVMVDPTWSPRLQSGLSSGEGLIWQVRDPICKKQPVKQKGKVVDYQDVLVEEGVADKRLLVIEAEFATALRVLGRDGSTLSAIIRTAWDGDHLQSMTKNSPARSTGAHVSIIGHITRLELLRYLTTTEAGNGYGNRHLWVCVRRSKLLPEGGHVPEQALEDLAIRLREVVAFARTVEEIKRDEGARVFWHEVYGGLSEGGPGLLGAVTSRAEAQVMRLACLYALLDKSALIRVERSRTRRDRPL